MATTWFYDHFSVKIDFDLELFLVCFFSCLILSYPWFLSQTDKVINRTYFLQILKCSQLLFLDIPCIKFEANGSFYFSLNTGFFAERAIIGSLKNSKKQSSQNFIIRIWKYCNKIDKYIHMYVDQTVSLLAPDPITNSIIYYLEKATSTYKQLL